MLISLASSNVIFWQIIQGIKGDEGKLTEFNVLIKERGTRFSEKITIDEINNVEYFHVPAHNRLTEADYLYDFQSVSK